MATHREWHSPGEYFHEGIAYNKDISLQYLLEIRDHMEMFSDDIIVATYPKTGEINWTITQILIKDIKSILFQIYIYIPLQLRN